MSYETAKYFWCGLEQYPKYPNVKERRLIDVNFIVKHMGDSRSVMDLGCADGYLLIALREFSNIGNFFGYDISANMLDKLKDRWGNSTNLVTGAVDFTNVTTYPEVDMTLSMGMFPYIFDNSDLMLILSGITSDTFIVRVPCTLKEEDEYINTYSEDLASDYSSLYRTRNSYLDLFSKFYSSIGIERAYDDAIESNYGTKHYFFVCKNRKEN